MNAPVVPVARHGVAQDPGAGHDGARLPRPELNGHASLFPAPLLRSHTRRAVIGRRSCSTTSAADGSPGVRTCAGRGSIGVAAHRFARAGIVPG